MKTIKALIFDLDGTIGDTLPLCIRAFREAIEPLIGHSLSDQEIIATFGSSEEGTIRALAPQYYDQGVEAYLEFYQTLHGICPESFPGIMELLTWLKENNIPIAMVTGKGFKSTEISLHVFGMRHFFELIETGSPGGPRKAEGIQAVLDHWKHLSKEQVYYIGDAPSDIEASRKAGIPVVSAAWAATAEPEKLEQLQPDHIFHTISAFTNWIKQNVQE